ncbi:MAG: hypothetical protein M2R45_04813 [Verrucomicrobia subdivision 3 bacterium]|nr:hypothetical protein [Limisphaerales bacterium]MCS1417298.1 hypothetical protein [Limisphaerales bacterium]
MQSFLEYVVKGLVERPDTVLVESTERVGVTVYQLKLHPSDMGKVIGKQGNMINAIRALLQVGSAKQGLRSILEVVENDSKSEGDAGEG